MFLIIGSPPSGRNSTVSPEMSQKGFRTLAQNYTAETHSACGFGSVLVPDKHFLYELARKLRHDSLEIAKVNIDKLK
jgi:hypothetical protein